MQRLVVALLLLVVVAWAQSSCPNGCSGHGSCLSNGTCACSSGWTGSDCSYSVTPLPPNQVISDSVAARMWKFYLLTLPTPATSLVFSLNQTSSGDCDLYIKLNNPPTRYDYDARDISTATQMSISWPNAVAGQYWIGSYGYTGCSYNVGVAASGGGTGVCPNSCSGHGVCKNSVCQCTPPWNGTDCSMQVSVLSPSKPTQGHVDQRTWVYYTIFVGAAANEMNVMVNQTTANEDCDLYLRQTALPTLHDYDYRQASDAQDFSLAVTEPALGTWYAGVYGFTSCDYTITLNFAQDCPNQCSLHGSCPQTTSCQCNSSFTGAYCETMIPPLMPMQVQVGYASDNSWNYYHFNAFSADNMVVSVNQTSANGDCDLYLKSDSQPTRFQYDYRDISFNNNMTISVPNPADRTWYIGVYGYRACAYAVSVTTTSSCPNACSNAGICFSGVCLCDPNYSGADCSVTLSTLPNGQLTSGTVQANTWAYFRLAPPAPGTSVVSITAAVHEVSTQGLVWVYVAAQQSPTLRAYDHADTSQSASHVLHWNPDATESSPSTVWTVGVYGSPFMNSGQTVNFTLIAWTAAM